MAMLPGFLRRWRARLRYRQFSDDVADELRVHRDMTEEALARGGATGDEIHRRASRMIGNELRAREEVRGVDGTSARSSRAGRALLPAAAACFEGLAATTIVAMYQAEPGFDPEGVTIAKISLQGRMTDPAVAVDFVERTRRELMAMPGITAVAVANNAPIERGLNLALEPPAGGRIARRRSVDWRFVTPDFFSALRIPLRAGREFDDRDRSGAPPVALVNESFVRHYFGSESPMGRVIAPVASQGDPPREIIGVVGDVRSKPGSGWTMGFSAMGADAPPIIYVPLLQVPPSLMSLTQRVYPMTWIVRTSAPAADLPQGIEAAVRRVDRSVALSRVTTMREVLEADVAGPRVLASLVGAFAVLALLVAGVGVYGVVVYATSQRARETAIRVALGATRASLVRELLGETAVLAGLGVTIGLALIAAASGVMTAMFRPSGAIDMTTIALGTLTLIAALGLASAIPALRAADMDPLRALRE